MTTKDIDKLKKYYEEELAKKDKEIEKLKEENLIILKSALSQAEKVSKISEHARKLFEINKKLSEKNK